MGTRAHQLAMFVVYESPLQVATDSPYNYRMSPQGLDFLKRVPTTWDDTRVIDGYPGRFIVIARQSGGDWFLGGMNGDDARTVEIALGFLDSGRYTTRIIMDADEVMDYPERIWEKEIQVTNRETLKATMASGGGYVVHFKRAGP
jgi:alpha-glucosidase